MKIHSIKCTDCNDTIFSFHQHDYQKCQCGNSFLDGGFDYIRANKDVQFNDIKDIIELVRNKFYWGKNQDEKGNKLKKTEYALLKDLTSSHICGILSYFTNKAFNNLEKEKYIDKEWCIINEIFIEELNYRIKNKLI